MTEKTYREELEEGFAVEMKRFAPLMDEDANADRLSKVMAISFALNAANTVVRKIRRRISEVSSEVCDKRAQALLATDERLRGAFDNLLHADSTDYEGLRKLVCSTLQRLSKPYPEEKEIADQIGDEVINETTHEFKEIIGFLDQKTAVKA